MTSKVWIASALRADAMTSLVIPRFTNAPLIVTAWNFRDKGLFLKFYESKQYAKFNGIQLRLSGIPKYHLKQLFLIFLLPFWAKMKTYENQRKKLYGTAVRFAERLEASVGFLFH